MKWIGQHIVDLVARFRGDFYLDNISNPNADTDKFLVVKDGKVGYRTGTEVLSDIGGSSTTGDIDRVSLSTDDSNYARVVSGNADFNLSGGACIDTSSDNNVTATIAVDLSELSTETNGDTVTEGALVYVDAENGQGKMSPSNIDISSFNNDAGYASGDITAVTAGTNLTGGGTSGGVTINLANASTSAKGAASFASADFAVSSGAVSLADLTVAHLAASAVQTGSESFSDNNTSLMTSAAIQDKIEAYGYVTNNIASDTFTVTSSTTERPMFRLYNTTNDASCPEMWFVNQRGADGQDGDAVGRIDFWSYDDGTPTLHRYARIEATIHDATDSEESGQLVFQIANHDSGLGNGLTLRGGSENDEIDATIGLGGNSVVTVPGKLEVGGSIRGKQIQVYHGNWKGAAGTTETFIPLAGVPDEQTSGMKEQQAIIMPTSGVVKQIILRMHWTSTITTSDDITWTIYKRPSNKRMNGTTTVGSFTMTNPTQGATEANNTRASSELSYAYSQYDALAISMQWASTGPTNNADRIYVTVVVENTLDDLGF